MRWGTGAGAPAGAHVYAARVHTHTHTHTAVLTHTSVHMCSHGSDAQQHPHTRARGRARSLSTSLLQKRPGSLETRLLLGLRQGQEVNPEPLVMSEPAALRPGRWRVPGHRSRGRSTASSHSNALEPTGIASGETGASVLNSTQGGGPPPGWAASVMGGAEGTGQEQLQRRYR